MESRQESSEPQSYDGDHDDNHDMKTVVTMQANLDLAITTLGVLHVQLLAANGAVERLQLDSHSRANALSRVQADLERATATCNQWEARWKAAATGQDEARVEVEAMKAMFEEEKRLHLECQQHLQASNVECANSRLRAEAAEAQLDDLTERLSHVERDKMDVAQKVATLGLWQQQLRTERSKTMGLQQQLWKATSKHERMTQQLRDELDETRDHLQVLMQGTTVQLLYLKVGLVADGQASREKISQADAAAAALRYETARLTKLNMTLHQQIQRYSDFRSFRSSLLDPSTTLCGSCVELADEAPVAHGFPKRKWIFSNTKRVIMERQEGLAVFLDRVNVSVRNCHHPDCMSRPLLEKFLMLADMRYTFIDMQLHDNTDESTAAPTRPAAITFIPPPSSLRHSFADTLGSRRSDVPDLLRHSFHGTQVRHRRHSVHVSSADRIKKFRELAPIKVAPKADKKRMSLETIEEVAE
ncbi:hypothetical protein DYB38_005804 [Aphanomyces astaci]|uniref:PX domain-containing protein n=1 Tax=Aphanomyces astaci TaxID=112090 RepID=A0A397DQY6_APHAT|nr:hypothetical protein DYB38_005804 [Aphanomyces astaci]